MEASRILAVCNACRYCEGYCAVFPAMEHRLHFKQADVYYLANLCHNCAECYYACQFAPPHEFAVNVPKVLAEARLRSYQQYAWPRLLRKPFQEGMRSTIAAVVLLLLAALPFARRNGGGMFYAVVPHQAMVAIFGFASLLVLVIVLAASVASGGSQAKQVAILGTPPRWRGRSAASPHWNTLAVGDEAARTRMSGTRRPGAGFTSWRHTVSCSASPPRR